MSKRLYEKAVEAINKKGILLVYPIKKNGQKNKKLPPSIWSELFPRSEMKWSWDSDSDGRVSQVWHLKEQLSKSREVAYGKWYKGRATFFSLECFTLMKAMMQNVPLQNPDALRMKESLEMDSPLSTKQIRAELGLQGKSLERQFTNAAKSLWERLDIVGFGEIEDSSFPSMAFAASSLIFEEEAKASGEISAQEAESKLAKLLGEDSEFLAQASKILKKSIKE